MTADVKRERMSFQKPILKVDLCASADVESQMTATHRPPPGIEFNLDGRVTRGNGNLLKTAWCALAGKQSPRVHGPSRRSEGLIQVPPSFAGEGGPAMVDAILPLSDRMRSRLVAGHLLPEAAQAAA